MGALKSKTDGVNLRAKLGLFVLILILGFAILDVGPLKSLHDQLKYTHIQESQLNQIRRLLFKIYLLKAVWVFLLSGIAVVFGLWIIRPYKKLLEKLSCNKTES